MEKILYLECNSGISGDMTVGALLDLGADRGALERALGSLGVGGYHLHFGRTKKCGLDAFDFDVHLEGWKGSITTTIMSTGEKRSTAMGMRCIAMGMKKLDLIINTGMRYTSTITMNMGQRGIAMNMKRRGTIANMGRRPIAMCMERRSTTTIPTSTATTPISAQSSTVWTPTPA